MRNSKSFRISNCSGISPGSIRLQNACDGILFLFKLVEHVMQVDMVNWLNFRSWLLKSCRKFCVILRFRIPFWYMNLLQISHTKEADCWIHSLNWLDNLTSKFNLRLLDLDFCSDETGVQFEFLCEGYCTIN